MTGSKCNKAVVLAAGGGTRVRSLATDRPKCLIDLGGKPIIHWVLRALAEGGISRVLMITGFGAPTLRRALGRGKSHGLEIRYIHNPEWTRPNGLSLYAARKAFRKHESFLTLMCDHLLPPGIIARVARARSQSCVLAVDTDVANVFDLSDATKVRLTGGRPVAIGKKLRTYNAVDCGLFRFDRRVFSALKQAFEKDRMALTDGVKILIENGDLDAIPVNKTFWIDIDTPKAHRQALRSMDMFTSALRGKGKWK
jgi:choline kinase